MSVGDSSAAAEDLTMEDVEVEEEPVEFKVLLNQTEKD